MDHSENAGPELVALAGGVTRTTRSYSARLALARRLLAACDGDAEQACGVMRMLATAPMRRAPGPAGGRRGGFLFVAVTTPTPNPRGGGTGSGSAPLRAPTREAEGHGDVGPPASPASRFPWRFGRRWT